MDDDDEHWNCWFCERTKVPDAEIVQCASCDALACDGCQAREMCTVRADRASARDEQTFCWQCRDRYTTRVDCTRCDGDFDLIINVVADVSDADAVCSACLSVD